MRQNEQKEAISAVSQENLFQVEKIGIEFQGQKNASILSIP